MRASHVVVCGLVAVMALGGTRAASAQTSELETLRQEVEALRSRLAALEAKVGASPAATPAAAAPEAAAPTAAPAEPTAEVPPGAAGAGGPGGALPVYGSASAASKIFNPDIAVIGNFLGAAGRNTVHPSPALELPESEASFQAIVDPYARADFFFAFGEEGVSVEEGYLTFPSLPGGLLAKVGRMRAAFGKVNTLHSHAIPWTDRPIAINNLVNGEEGISDAGISVARLISNPWVFLEATGQVFRGDSGDVFHSSKPGDLSYVGRLRGYQDISESTNVDLGASYARGRNDAAIVADQDPRSTTELWGVDATVRWRPLRRAIYNSFVGRSELFWSRREELTRRQQAFGYYVSGDYQFNRRWVAGARYDRSGRADDAALRDTGGSILLTFLPSEFSEIRGQYRRTQYAQGENANEFLFQFQFSIGAHGAHPF
jgi:hypothetical protein